jgi:hypothetical protein
MNSTNPQSGLLLLKFRNSQSEIRNPKFPRPPLALRPPLTRGVPLSLQVNLSNNADQGGLADSRNYSPWANHVKHCFSITILRLC